MIVIVNKKKRDLDYISSHNVDNAQDFIQAAQYTRNEEGYPVMDIKTYQYWKRAISKQEKLDEMIKSYPELFEDYYRDAPGDNSDPESTAEAGIAWYKDQIKNKNRR